MVLIFRFDLVPQAQIEAHRLSWFLLPAGTGCHAWCNMWKRGLKTCLLALPIWAVMVLCTVAGCAVAGHSVADVTQGKQCHTGWIVFTALSNVYNIVFSILTIYLIWEAARNEEAHDAATLEEIRASKYAPVNDEDSKHES